MPETYVNVYDQVGEREDLIDIITNITPTETVALSRFGRGNAKSFKHDWLTDTLATADSGNAIVDGASATFASSDYVVRTLVSNYTQILRRNISVSYSQQAIVQAGLNDEFDYQREKKTKEIARDLDSALINQTSASGTSAAARRLNGALAAITTNTSAMAGQPVSQTGFNQVLQLCWDQGGSPNAAYVAGFNKRTISNWTQPGGQRNIDATGKRIIQAVDKYDSDFGVILIVLERFMPAAQIMILEEQYWKVAYMRPLFFEKLGAVGEQARGSVVSEATLEYLAENSSGKITGTATS